jgi:hypothetical protein
LLTVGLLSLGWVFENGQSLAAVKRLQPKRALFVGMTHEFEHESDNAALAEWSKREGIPVQLAYDGLRIPIHL